MSIYLTNRERSVLTALFGNGPAAREAFEAWRSSVRFSDVERLASTLIPKSGNATGDRPAKGYLTRNVRRLREAILAGAGQRVASRDFDDAFSYRTMPALVEAAQRFAPEDPDLRRMRGVVKSQWLHNTLRMKAVLQVLASLEASNIQSMLIKGAAMFARDPSRMTRRCTHDFDLLVRRCDLPRAIRVVEDLGYVQNGVRADRFEGRDFFRLHAVMVKRAAMEDFDLHWWPTPHLHDDGYVDDMFENAETVMPFGRRVLVPSLADHLALSTMRAHGDRLEWALDTRWLLERFGDRIDWARTARLLEKYRACRKARRYLGALARRTGAQVPQDFLSELDRRSGLLEWLESEVVEHEALRETPFKLLVYDFIAVALRDRELSRAKGTAQLAWRLALNAKARSRIRSAARARFGNDQRTLQDHWRGSAGLGRSISFERPEFGEGWSLPDEAGRWTQDRFAVVAIPVDAPYGALCQIEAVVRPFFPPGRTTFSLRFTTDGQRLEQATFTEYPATWRFPARVIGAGQRKVILAMELTDAGTPAQFGLSDDDRLLGINIETIGVVVNGAISNGTDCAGSRPDTSPMPDSSGRSSV